MHAASERHAFALPNVAVDVVCIWIREIVLIHAAVAAACLPCFPGLPAASSTHLPDSPSPDESAAAAATGPSDIAAADSAAAAAPATADAEAAPDDHLGPAMAAAQEGEGDLQEPPAQKPGTMCLTLCPQQRSFRVQSSSAVARRLKLLEWHMCKMQL
jgi:hypothetical protein